MKPRLHLLLRVACRLVLVLLLALFVQTAGAQLPVFQYAIFYNLNMEMDPTPAMVINGPVFCNQSIWEGSDITTFHSTVNAVGTNSTGTSALANAYGQKIEYSGPVNASMKVEGSTIRIKFTHAAGLTAKDGLLKWFQISGADQNFVSADAKIDGDSVIVSSPAVTAPVAVRYAWDNYPDTANLFNGAGLQAAPFRTDNWDAMPPIAEQMTAK